MPAGLSVLLGNGDGSFAPPITTAAGLHDSSSWPTSTPMVAPTRRWRTSARTRSRCCSTTATGRPPTPAVGQHQRRDGHRRQHRHRQRHLHRDPVAPPPTADVTVHYATGQRHRHGRQRLPGRVRHADHPRRPDHARRSPCGQRRPPRRADRDLRRQPEQPRPTRPSPTARAWAPSSTTSRASASAT